MYNWNMRRRSEKKKKILVVIKADNFSQLITNTKAERTPSRIMNYI